ncbi:MAG: flagellar biosynthesis protein FlhA [Bdellovibrionota bacterium]
MLKVKTPKSDIVLALFVVAVAAMLLMPLPTVVLDFLLALNLSFALLLLLVGLYMPNALALSAFPSLLLLTTLFRLGLNVASTRLILSAGEAGRVIEAFGTFLIRGEVVVGVIIFTIITVVNFIVIARGSSRVSEVAARFALDALPGKQMAIDSDLRAGTITAKEAQKKREDLQKESQLFGSMDGAMRFVQGDAIAGFFIIVTNIIGGMYLGVTKGMSFSEAIQTYTTLTVGDGLVSQIPALLISICAGVVVTRVSSEDSSTLGSDVGEQLFERPGVLVLSAILLLFVGLLPGIPILPFFTIAAFCIGIALYVRGSSVDLTEQEAKLLLTGSDLALPAGTSIEEVPEDAVLLIRLDKHSLYPAYLRNRAEYLEWWAAYSRQFKKLVGTSLPALYVTFDNDLPDNNYSFDVRGTFVESGELPLDALLVQVRPDKASLLGAELLSSDIHPWNGEKVSWIRTDGLGQSLREFSGLATYDFLEWICLKASLFLKRNPQELLSISDTYQMLQKIEKQHPGLISNALSSSFISVSRLTRVLHELIKENIPITDFQHTIEQIAAYCASNGISLNEEQDFDLQDMISSLRIKRRRTIVNQFQTKGNSLRVLNLSEQLSNVFEDITLNHEEIPLPLHPDVFEGAKNSLNDILNPLIARGSAPIAILCRSEARAALYRFLRSVNHWVGVLTYDELDPLISIESVGEWTVEGL